MAFSPWCSLSFLHDIFGTLPIVRVKSVKPFVIDRKNFLFANTPRGATGSAVMFSLIQPAIENNLNPHKYLTWLMKTANGADLSQKDMIHTLLPWNAPQDCKTK